MLEGKLREFLAELSIPILGKGHKGWLTARCPFAPWTHEHGRDRNPGFGVKIENLGISSYHCLTCKKHGNIPDLVKALEDIREENYGTLHVRTVLAEADTPLEPWDANTTAETEPEPQPLAESMFLGMYPLASEVTEAAAYLASRGISSRTANLAGLKYDPTESRVVVPIYDKARRLFGFNGRTILPEEAWPDNGPSKAPYKKTKDYAGLKKSHNLMGIHLANPNKPFFVVEGLFAYLHLLEIGSAQYVNVVATLGSSLSDRQRDMLVEWGVAVYLCYDNDEAGEVGLFGVRDEEGKFTGNGAVDKLRKHVPVFIPLYPAYVSDPDYLTLEQLLEMVEVQFTIG